MGYPITRTPMVYRLLENHRFSAGFFQAETFPGADYTTTVEAVPILVALLADASEIRDQLTS